MANKIVIYGIQFDLDNPSASPIPLNTKMCKSYFNAINSLNDVYPLKHLEKSVVDILANEIIRGRLGPYFNQIEDMKEDIREVHMLGYRYKEIVILRSLNLSFSAIRDYANMKYSIYDVLEELGIANPSIEAVPGINTNEWNSYYLKGRGF